MTLPRVYDSIGRGRPCSSGDTIETAAARLGLAVKIKLQLDASYPTMELVAQGMGHSITPGR